MKLALILLLVSLSACCGKKSASTESNTYPAFALDQEVQIDGGFYRGHAGKIVSWDICTDRDTGNNQICYLIVSLEGTKYERVNQKDLRK